MSAHDDTGDVDEVVREWRGYMHTEVVDCITQLLAKCLKWQQMSIKRVSGNPLCAMVISVDDVPKFKVSIVVKERPERRGDVVIEEYLEPHGTEH